MPTHGSLGYVPGEAPNESGRVVGLDGFVPLPKPPFCPVTLHDETTELSFRHAPQTVELTLTSIAQFGVYVP
jgi:hypothetical protein